MRTASDAATVTQNDFDMLHRGFTAMIGEAKQRHQDPNVPPADGFVPSYNKSSTTGARTKQAGERR